MSILMKYIMAGRLVLAVWLVLCPLTCGTSSQPKCYGEFDVYFILDKSSSVPKFNFQKETVNFVESILNGFQSSKSGTSFITFSDKNKEDVIMELTRDKDKIAQGIKDLRKVEPKGMTYLAGGIKKANEQIVRLGGQRASVVIIVTDGRAYDIDDSIKQATKSQSLGASVVTVGVGAFVLSELKDLASKPSDQFVFTSKKFDTLPNLISKIVEKSCIEILSASPTEVCTGVPYNVTLLGDGFTKTDDINKVICGYSFSDTYRTVQKPAVVEDTRLVCPGFMVNETDRTVILQMSVNKGLTFVSSNVTITSQLCEFPTNMTQATNMTTPAAEERVKATRTNVGLAVFLLLLFLFFIALILWWFKPVICKKKPKPAKYKPAPPIPPPPQSKTGPVKGKWPTVDASYYGGGGVGGIAPVRVDWGDKGSTEAGSKLAKAKGANSRDAEDTEKLTGKGSGGGGGGGGGGLLGCMAATKARISQGMAGCLAAMSRGYQRLSSYRPRPGGHLLYSTPDAHA